jgi:protein-disulfide isomerase
MEINNKKDSFDWITTSFIAAVCLLAVFTIYQISVPKSRIPKHKYIEGWKKMVINSPSTSVSEAKIQLIEFYSYSCSFCKILHSHLQKLKKKYPNAISFTYKPIYFHTFGQDYYDAIAAECAGMQHKFENYSNLLFKGKTDYKQVALESGISKMDNFIKCLQEKNTKDVVENNQSIADSLGLRGVPFLIINGQGYWGALSTNTLTEIVKNDLKKR